MSNQMTAPTRAKRAKGARLAERPPKRFPLKIIVLTVVVVALLAVVGALTYGVAVYDRIYPNVSIGGVEVSGQTADSAYQMLADIVGSKHEAQTITLLIAGERKDLSIEKTGIRNQAADTAQQAWSYGREGGFFARAGVVIASLFNSKEFPLNTDTYIDESAAEKFVADTAKDTAGDLDVPVVASKVEETGDGIVITVGKPGQKVDTDSLSAQLTAYLSGGDFSAPLVYNPMPTKPQPVDLNALFAQYDSPAEDAQWALNDKNNPTVIPDKAGRTFDQEAAQSALSNAQPGETVTIPFIAVPAAVSSEMLSGRLFADELSECITYLDAGNKPRVNNIHLAASFINGTILLPGDEFSFNGVVGERTTAKGYQQAGAYVSGRLVDETGGGICQMATTTYGAAIRADLKITARSNHSMTVGYVPLGQDATVSWGAPDLKFVNDTDYPIKILAEQSGSYVKVTVIGTKVHDYTVSFESETLSTTPYETVTKVNNDLAPGARKEVMPGHNGATAVSYRVYKDASGKVIKRVEEARSKYNKVDRLIEVGPGGTPSTPDTPTPTPDTPKPTPGTPTPAPNTPAPGTPTPDTPPPEVTPTPDTPAPEEPAAPVDGGDNDVWD